MKLTEQCFEVPSPKISSGFPPALVIVGFIILLSILAGSIWLVSPLFHNASSIVSNVSNISEVVKNIPEIVSVEQKTLSAEAIPIGSVAIEPIENGVRVAYDYMDPITITTATEQKMNGWVGIIKDPYSPLVNLAGTPFFDGTKYPIKPAKNILPLFKDNQTKPKITEETFPKFRYFSSTPTTIGIAKGQYSADLQTLKLELYLFDTDSKASVVITSSLMEFPHWMKRKDAPPSFYTSRYLMLTSNFNALGDIVIDSVQSYSDAEYKENSEIKLKFFEQEFSKAMLTRADLEVLSTANINKFETFKDPQWGAIRKFVRLCYYAPYINKTAPIKALIERVHPSIQKAAKKHPEFGYLTQ